MKNKSNLFSDWSDVTGGERNQIVFENLHKSYGAYEIRSNYDSTLRRAFAAIILFSILISGFFFLSTNIEPVILIPDTPPILVSPPPFIPPTIPPINPPVVPPARSHHPDELASPVVTDSIVKDPDNDPPLALNTNHSEGKPNDSSSVATDPGNSGTTSIPSEPEWPVDSVFDVPGERPQFPGGDEALLQFLRSNTRIPESVKEIGRVNEKVGVVFIVDKEGNVTSASILKGGCRYAALNNEALRVINKMPQWEPGKQNGHHVKARMILPIRFEVRE